jgi:hypothetical protein
MLNEALRRNPEILWARRLVWLYFWLLILEGALRKWVFPSLANPLLIIRDPVVVLIYLLVASRRMFPINGFVITSAIIAVLLGTLAITPLCHGNFWVMLYGLRTNFLHLPLIFIIPQIFSLNDVRAFGKAFLWISIPISALIVLQFLASPYSKLNAVVGGASGQIIGAMGHVRPSATFSFVTGTVSFLSLQFAFIIAAFMDRRDKFLRSFSLVGLIFSVICSISRSAVVACVLVLLATIVGLLINHSRIKRGLIFVLVAGLLAAAVSSTALFQKGSKVMNTRMEDASQGNDAALSLTQRIFNDLTEPIETLKQAGFWGAGTGAGTNVGAGILAGSRRFLLAEIEWSRLIMESGLFLGLALIVLRVWLSFYIFYWAFIALKRQDNWLPWLIMASILPWVFNGAWGQPTMLGFACLGGGFVLAATRPTYEDHALFSLAKRSIR